MEKRFVNFMVMSMLIMTTFVMLQLWMRPEQPAGPQADLQEQIDEQDDGGIEIGDAGDEDKAAARPDDVPPAEGLREKFPQKRASMGSIDPKGPYRMQVVVNSRGGTIEAIELSDPRFRDDDDNGAYIGYLALEDSPDGGCQVNVVPHGSPAANAVPDDGALELGLKKKDIITQLNDQPVNNAKELTAALGRLKHNAELRVTVRRQKDAQVVSAAFSLKSMRRPLEPIRREPFLPSDERNPLSFLWTFDHIDKHKAAFDQDEMPQLPSLHNEHWDLVDDDDDDDDVVTEENGSQIVTFRYPLPKSVLQPLGVSGKLVVIKRYRLDPFRTAESTPGRPGYHLSLQVEVINEGTEPVNFGYRFDGPTGLPLEGWWYSYKTHPRQWGRAGTRDVVWKDSRYEMFTNSAIVKWNKKNPDNPELSMLDKSSKKTVQLNFVGVDAQYFTVALVANHEGSQAGEHVYQDAFARVIGGIDDKRVNRTDVSYRLTSQTHTIPANGSFQENFTIFAGPRKPAVLEAYGLGQVISYGWFPMVAKPLQWILHFFHNQLGLNYGLAIILLTVLVRGCMFPLGRKQAMNAKKMQELAPEMKKLAEKYKNDMEKRAAAQQELFKKHDCHPLSGCLPSLIQLPIFVGLYKALSVDIELRQAPLIPGIHWASNLAAPDRLWHWEGVIPFTEFLTGANGMLGPYLNVLPLISTGLFLVQMKLFTPPATDEKQEMQQQMMKFMPIMMGFIFFKVPSGLCLYFIASSLWGLAERKLLPKTPDKPEVSSPKKKEPPRQSLMDKLSPKPKAPTNGAKRRKARKKAKRN